MMRERERREDGGRCEGGRERERGERGEEEVIHMWKTENQEK